MERDPLVLSVQSHVVHGRSGNRSSVLPLEVNGINVDPLNTVQFSAHGAYPNHMGPVLALSDFESIVNGLRLDEILPTYTHLLTGYVGNPNMIKEIAKLRKQLPQDVHFLCDPVLGDFGRVYVHEDCLALFRDILIPLADTITPNAYEAQWLTGLEMRDKDDLLAIVRELHNLGPKNVIITSTEWRQRFSFFSFEKGNVQFAVPSETFNRKFDGPGDVFSSLLMANMIRFPGEYEKIAARTVNSTFAVLKKTCDNKLRELALPLAIQEMIEPTIHWRPIPLIQFREAFASIERS